MNNVYELNQHLDATEKASEWLAKLDRGLTDQENIALQEWLNADMNNSVALMEVAQVWDKTEVLSRLANLFPKEERRSLVSFRYALAMAASVIVAIILTFWMVPNVELVNSVTTLSSNEDNVQNLETDIGERSIVNLTDGSQLTLNTNSRLQVMFTDKQRLLVLERGEVSLLVAKDESRPLTVQIGDKFIQAVGTAFNIKINHEDKVELIVMEGKVLVGLLDKQTKAPAESNLLTLTEPVPVSAGEQLLLGDSHEEVKKVEPDEIVVKLSWREGNIVFRGMSLEEALDEIERYTTVEFIVRDEELKKMRIVGLFKVGDVDGLLITLRENFNISSERFNDEVILTSN